MKTTKNVDLGALLIRLTVGILMLFHGIHKLTHGLDGVKYLLNEAGLPEFLSYGSLVGEILAPIGLILGLFTRISALLVAFTMTMTMFVYYGFNGFSINEFGGLNAELNLFFLFSALSIFFLGSGKYALSDKLLNDKLRNF